MKSKNNGIFVMNQFKSTSRKENLDRCLDCEFQCASYLKECFELIRDVKYVTNNYSVML